MSDVAKPWTRPWVASACAFFVIYLAAAYLSASTAFVQVNAAAVWAPSGFAIGLLIVRGRGLWPVVALGAFTFNLSLNLVNPVSSSLAVAASIAAGNTGEALLGAMLARRFASGSRFASQTRTAIAFALLVAPFPPLLSAFVGVTSSRLAGLQATGTIWDVALTWYVGNYVGIMVFTGLTTLALDGSLRLPPRARLAETLALTLCLCFVGQAIGGYFLSGWIGDWLKSYMAIPLILWACFRFEITGGPVSIALITIIAVVGTLRGFVAFPSKTPWLALIYLQVFIGMLSVISLAVSASIAELKAGRATLEDRVRVRTKEIETLMREREVFTVLVAHDLQSPLYGIRNALRASSAALTGGHMNDHDLVDMLGVMERTYSTLSQHVASLLLSGRDQLTLDGEVKTETLDQIFQRIASAHGIKLGTAITRLVQCGDLSLSVARPDDVEHIVDTLVDNALKYTSKATPIEVVVFRHGGWIEIQVRDFGPGLRAADRRDLFLPRPTSTREERHAGTGIGLYLASEKAIECGGRLTYAPSAPDGSVFRLVIPV